MLKQKKKLLTVVTCFIASLVLMVNFNTNEALAFGGDYTITDANGSSYTKEAPTQISVSYDSGGNLIVSGFSFFTNTQQYISKGTGANNTHYYRLKIDGTSFVYNDSLVGGDNYTDKAKDAGRETATANETIYCASGDAVDTSGTKKNTQLQQVSFKFVIPASDLKQLADTADSSTKEYRLVLEHNLTNVKFKSTGSTKHKLTFNITKLIDANLTQNTTLSKDITGNMGTYTMSVSAVKGFDSVRINAGAVRLRTSTNDFAPTSGTYNNGYFVERDNREQRDILHDIAGKTVNVDGYLGTALIPISCTFNKTTTTSVDMTLEQLFTQKPSLRNEYTSAGELSAMQSSILIVENRMYTCNTTSHKNYWIAQGSKTYCPACASANGSELESMRNDYAAKVKRNSEIEAMCHTSSSSTANTTEIYYCKSMYVEAEKTGYYYSYIQFAQKSANVKVITRTQKENVNTTTLGAIQTINTTTSPISNSNLTNGQTIQHKSASVGVVVPTGYHIESIVDDYTGSKVTRSASNTISVPYTRSITIKGKLPVGQQIYVDYVFRNDAPKINKK